MRYRADQRGFGPAASPEQLHIDTETGKVFGIPAKSYVGRQVFLLK